MPYVESVTAERIFSEICLKLSVIRMRELARGADLDIFLAGSRSERIRFVGAEFMINISSQNKNYRDIRMMCCGIGKILDLALRLNISARSRHNSMCWR